MHGSVSVAAAAVVVAGGSHDWCGCAATVVCAAGLQMYALLALVVALCPAVQGSLDEHVLAALKDKFGEKLQVRGGGEGVDCL